MSSRASCDHLWKVSNTRLRNLFLIIGTENHLQFLNERITSLKAVFQRTWVCQSSSGPGCSKSGQGPGAWASPGSLLEMSNLSSPPRPTESKPTEERRPPSDLFAHSTLRSTGVDYSGRGRFDLRRPERGLGQREMNKDGRSRPTKANEVGQEGRGCKRCRTFRLDGDGVFLPHSFS